MYRDGKKNLRTHAGYSERVVISVGYIIIMRYHFKTLSLLLYNKVPALSSSSPLPRAETYTHPPYVYARSGRTYVCMYVRGTIRTYFYPLLYRQIIRLMYICVSLGMTQMDHFYYVLRITTYDYIYIYTLNVKRNATPIYTETVGISHTG